MKRKKVGKNMFQKQQTFYSDFRNKAGKRIVKSLGNDKEQAKINLLKLKANPDIQHIQINDPTPRIKRVSFNKALNMYIESVFGVVDALNKPKWCQWKERQEK